MSQIATRFKPNNMFWKDRLRASGIHFGISCAIAALAALVVFLIWYPNPYREISGGRELFLILVTVDVILGPLITLAIFNPVKAWPVLRRDLAFVGLIQLAALAYGMWTVFVARPVFLVFELDRFRVVHAIDVPPNLLDRAPVGFQALPLLGPKLLAVRPFRDADESFSATMDAMEGVPLSARPDLWQPYAEARTQVLKAAKPALDLKKRFSNHADNIDRVITRSGHSPDTVVYLPLAGRKVFWTALLDSTTAEPIGFLPLDSF
jgi:hypothetical protein